MDARKAVVVSTTTIAALLFLTGCPKQQTRTNNQGGGNIVTAGAKVAGGNIAALTPDEIQILADNVTEFQDTPVDVPELTDAQATAASDFLIANDVKTIEDVQSLIQQIEADPTSIVIPDSVQQLIDGGVFG